MSKWTIQGQKKTEEHDTPEIHHPTGEWHFFPLPVLKNAYRLFLLHLWPGQKGKASEALQIQIMYRLFYRTRGKERGKKVIEPNGELQLCSCPRVGHENKPIVMYLTRTFLGFWDRKAQAKNVHNGLCPARPSSATFTCFLPSSFRFLLSAILPPRGIRTHFSRVRPTRSTIYLPWNTYC